MALVELQPTTGPLPRTPAMGWAIDIDQDGTTLLEDGQGQLLDSGEFWKRMEPALPFASQLYPRLPWSEHEPEQGRYAWACKSRFREIIHEAERRGLRLAFRWYTNSHDCHRLATPEYLRAAGAGGDTLPTDRNGPLDGRWWWTPWSVDPVLHRCLAELVQAFATRFIVDQFTMPVLPAGHYRWAVAPVARCRNDQPWITLAAEGAKPGCLAMEGVP